MKMFHFYNKLLWAMKSGYCTIMWNRRDHGASEINHHQPHQRPICIQRRWCCLYGGIRKGGFYYELLLETKQFQQVLLPIRPTESSTRWKASGISQQKMHNLPSAQHKPACFSDDQEKALQPRWEVLIHLLCSPDNAPSDCHLSQYV